MQRLVQYNKFISSKCIIVIDVSGAYRVIDDVLEANLFLNIPN